MSRCYDCDTETAIYEARLDWTAGVMLLCPDCAIWERQFGSVIEIKTFVRGDQP